MKRSSHTITSLGFFILFLGVLAWLVLQKPDAFLQIKLLILTDHPSYAVAHFLGLAVAFLLFIAAWRTCVSLLGVHCSWQAACFSWLVPNLGKYLPGKVLMLGGRIELLRCHGVGRSIGSTALVFEHALMLLAVAPFLAVTVLFQGAETPTSTALISFGMVVILLLTIVIFPSIPIQGINLVLRKLQKKTIQTAPSRTALLGVIALYFTLWTLYGMSGFFLVKAMFPNTDINIPYAMSAFPSAWLLGFLTVIAPGGIGVREAALVLALRLFMPADQALSVAITSRLTWTLTEMCGVLIGWIIGNKGLGRFWKGGSCHSSERKGARGG